MVNIEKVKSTHKDVCVIHQQLIKILHSVEILPVRLT